MTTMDALVFEYLGHGIPFSNYKIHLVLVFDLTSTQQAFHDFFYPELTNAAVSVELKVSTALPGEIELFLLGEKASTIYIDSNRKVSKILILHLTTSKWMKVTSHSR